MYRVLIEKIETVKCTGREWHKVADSGNKHDKGPVYDYVTFDSESTTTTKILEQHVEQIDMAGVIKAVNGLQ